jgi:hypothetical protein
MLIYAENSQIIFECEHCHAVERLDIAYKTKRQFQRVLNRFYRAHDWHCELKMEQQRKVSAAIDMADAIIKQLSETCR